MLTGYEQYAFRDVVIEPCKVMDWVSLVRKLPSIFLCPKGARTV